MTKKEDAIDAAAAKELKDATKGKKLGHGKTLVKKEPVTEEIGRKPLDFEPHAAPLHTDKVVSATILDDVVTVTFADASDAEHFFVKMHENMTLEEPDVQESADSGTQADAGT